MNEFQQFERFLAASEVRIEIRCSDREHQSVAVISDRLSAHRPLTDDEIRRLVQEFEASTSQPVDDSRAQRLVAEVWQLLSERSVIGNRGDRDKPVA